MEEEITATELLDKGIAATRQLAKRQLTWLRSTENIGVDCLSDNLHDQVMTTIRRELYSNASGFASV